MKDLAYIEKYRIKDNPNLPPPELCRYYEIPHKGTKFFCSVSVNNNWDHIGVSLKYKRTPTWEEMCFIKDVFFDPEEVVIQFHPKRSEYINIMPYCLHLWKYQLDDIKTPHLSMLL